MPIMLGLPSSFLLGGDINTFGCVISWYLVFHSPSDFFYQKVCSFLPFQIFYISGAQLFRATGIYGFVDKALTVGMKPCEYYPTPVLGPILTASLLSNVGPIFRLGYKDWFKVRENKYQTSLQGTSPQLTPLHFPPLPPLPPLVPEWSPLKLPILLRAFIILPHLHQRSHRFPRKVPPLNPNLNPYPLHHNLHL